MRETVLITGASGGIGLELARVFAREGFDLLLVARSGEKLREIEEELTRQHPVSVKSIVKDLAGPSAAQELFREVQKIPLSIDVLVNNAGIGSFGPFAETELSMHEQLMMLNMVSLTQLTALFLKPMLERKRGKILNVASTAAFQPGPLMAVYYATKAYVLHLSEALSNELEGSGVTVTALCPGATETGFQRRAQMDGSRLFRVGVMDARTVAEQGFRGLLRGKTIVIPGLKNRLLTFSLRFSPRALVVRVVRAIQKKD